MLSVILYLNPNWMQTDGGQLRVYNETDYSDINPEMVGGVFQKRPDRTRSSTNQ